MCEKAVDIYPQSLQYVPDQYKTNKMFKIALKCRFMHWILFVISARLKNFFEKAVEREPSY